MIFNQSFLTDKPQKMKNNAIISVNEFKLKNGLEDVAFIIVYKLEILIIVYLSLFSLKCYDCDTKKNMEKKPLKKLT